MPIPAPVAADATGLDDSIWITKVRDALRDYPKYTTESWTADGSNGVVAVTGAPLTVAKPPINITGTAGDINQGTTSLQVKNASLPQVYTVITSGTPNNTQVLVNHNTGEIQWATAPTTGNVIQLSYQAVRWTDASISEALYDGLHRLFPAVGKTYVDTSIQIQANQWDYTMPQWFQDPRSKIIQMEVNDLSIPTEPYKIARGGEKRVGLNILHLPWSQRYGPTARVRIVGWGPYLQLGDLEPQLHHLPIWYALGALLSKQEAKRIREDTLVPMANIGQPQAGMLIQVGDYYTRRFEAALDALKRLPGPTPSRPWPSMRQAMRY